MNPEWGKILMVMGAVLFTVGALLAFNVIPWIGRLPGDFVWRKGPFSFYFPLITCFLVSIILTILLNYFKR